MPTNDGLPASLSGFSYNSAHRGVVQFTFADGSVRALRSGIKPDPNGVPGPDTPYRHWLRAGGINDGEVIDPRVLGD
jgi:prepilin-type processing-associated H-X9-DG protein